MTNQEIFDKVAKHLLTQNKRAVDPIIGRCQYRTSDGLKCAAGVMISDDEYSPKMEGKAISHLITAHKLTKLDPFYELLHSLQHVHDLCQPVEWKQQLIKLAERYNLSSAILD